MELPTAWAMITTGVVTATAAIVASVATQLMTASRERHHRRTEAETKRRHHVEDLQRATLVDFQDSIRELLNETTSIISRFIFDSTLLSESGQHPESIVNLGALHKSYGQLLASEARVFALMTRVRDIDAKTLVMKFIELCQHAKGQMSKNGDLTAIINVPFVAFMAASRRIGELIQALDEAALKG